MRIMIARELVRRSVGFAVLAVPFVAGGAVPESPTYTKDVAPILNANCVMCHRAGDIGPMSLMSFEEVRPWAKSIQKALDEGVMPPWHADEGIGHFKNERKLTADERATIVRWIEQGTKQGDPSDLPPLPEFPENGWRLGQPDLVVEFNKIDLPAGGPDQFHDLTGATGLTEDTWVKAVEVIPGNRKVVHHVILWQGNEGGERGWIGAWAAGMDPMVFPENTGRLVKANVPIIGDMHYHPADTAESDATKIGLYFAEGNKVDKELINLWVQNASFEIPAGADDYGARASYTFTQDAYITSLLPHLHYRGKDFTYTARFPDGRREKILSVSDYDFNWQTGYEFAEPLYVPKGTRIDCVAHWDNSANNPDNPDPTKNVRFGSESFNEMMIGFVDYYVKDGQRPISAQEAMRQLGDGLVAKHGGDIFYADVNQGEDNPSIQGVAYFPRNAATGVWHVNMLGSMYEAPVTNVAWTDNELKGRVDIMGQAFDFVVSLNPESGELNGNLVLPPGEDETITISGKKFE